MSYLSFVLIQYAIDVFLTDNVSCLNNRPIEQGVVHGMRPSSSHVGRGPNMPSICNGTQQDISLTVFVHQIRRARDLDPLDSEILEMRRACESRR